MPCLLPSRHAVPTVAPLPPLLTPSPPRCPFKQAGTILIDGRNLNQLDNGWLRRHVSLVSQEPMLFNTTIRDNIMMGLTVEDGVREDELPSE